MLPSGNDAAVALAEHFGRKLQEQQRAVDPNSRDPSQWGLEACYLRFVKEMNTYTKKQGWKSASFGNPHGYHLAEKGNPRPVNKMSALDVASMTRLAMHDKRIAAVVGAREFKATSTGGKTFPYINGTHGLYKGHPELELNIDGLDGCKNGGTKIAKFCMASSVRHSETGAWVIGVTLASETKLKRTQDTQRLHSWARKALSRDRETV